MKVLTDKSRSLVALFNCQFNSTESKILCGAAFFMGGLSGELSLFSEDGQEFRVKIPQEIGKNKTSVVNINLEIELSC